MAKRVFDLLFCLSALLVVWPVFLLTAVAIVLDDGGAVFFRQARVGLRGRPFHILKFRTMRGNTAPAQPSITAAGDPRVTKVGYWLRRTKIDELPQLWNVLVGDMSLVGPRPEVPRYVAFYTEAQREVLRLKPGITDEASIAFRDEEKLLAGAVEPERFYLEYCIPRKIDINLAYARKATVISDIEVILQTLWVLRPARKPKEAKLSRQPFCD